MIVVFGSINIDLVTRAERIPGPGETVLGSDYVAIPGGKGANQALAARRAGARVALVGAYGQDGFAEPALALLKADGVELSHSRAAPKPTGAAFIVVDPPGENAIVVASGAKASAEASQLQAFPFGPGDRLLLQREVPIPEVEAAAAFARARGARAMLNAAPAGALSPKLAEALDFLCVNEHVRPSSAPRSASPPQTRSRSPRRSSAGAGSRPSSPSDPPAPSAFIAESAFRRRRRRWRSSTPPPRATRSSAPSPPRSTAGSISPRR